MPIHLMKKLLRWSHVATCMLGMLGLAACGGRPSGGNGGIDGNGTDGAGSDTASVPPASCAVLPKTCGVSGTDSCCDSPQVVGGSYFRSYDVAGDPNSGNMSYPATVSGFRLDKYEVTVGRFRAFVQAGMGTQANPPPAGAGAHAKISGSGWDSSWNARLVGDTGTLTTAVKCNVTFQTWTDTPGASEHRPMNCITWFEAMAFCAWDGGYLPSEAEWNYAATGGEQQRAYPWATLTIDGSHASYYDGTNCVGDGLAGCAATDLVPVGTKPDGDGRWNQSDLAGNVAEWTLDWLSVYPSPCVDCARVASGADRVTRGGNYGESTFYMRTGTRSALNPMTRSHGFGVRCARAP